MNIARAVPITAAIIAAEATTATPAGSQRRLAPRNTQARSGRSTPTAAAHPAAIATMTTWSWVTRSSHR